MCVQCWDAYLNNYGDGEWAACRGQKCRAMLDLSVDTRGVAVPVGQPRAILGLGAPPPPPMAACAAAPALRVAEAPVLGEVVAVQPPAPRDQLWDTIGTLQRQVAEVIEAVANLTVAVATLRSASDK